MATIQPGDKIYSGYNFSQIGRELTFDKLWQIFQHMKLLLKRLALPNALTIATSSDKEKPICIKFFVPTNILEYFVELVDFLLFVNIRHTLLLMPLSCLSECRRDCPKHHRPQCGSDGVTYSNKCLLKIVSF